jgi:hypothetical protein
MAGVNEAGVITALSYGEMQPLESWLASAALNVKRTAEKLWPRLKI